jgi:hypothetical protein
MTEKQGTDSDRGEIMGVRRELVWRGCIILLWRKDQSKGKHLFFIMDHHGTICCPHPY